MFGLGYDIHGSGDIADAGESFASEAESGHALEVAKVSQLGGGETLAKKRQVGWLDTGAIVLDLEHLDATSLRVIRMSVAPASSEFSMSSLRALAVDG